MAGDQSGDGIYCLRHHCLVRRHAGPSGSIGDPYAGCGGAGWQCWQSGTGGGRARDCRARNGRQSRPPGHCSRVADRAGQWRDLRDWRWHCRLLLVPGRETGRRDRSCHAGQLCLGRGVRHSGAADAEAHGGGSGRRFVCIRPDSDGYNGVFQLPRTGDTIFIIKFGRLEVGAQFALTL